MVEKLFKGISIYENCNSGITEEGNLIVQLNIAMENEEVVSFLKETKITKNCRIIASREDGSLLEMEVERFLEINS